MSSLIERMRKAREQRLALGDVTVTFIRPLTVEAVNLQFGDMQAALARLSAFVVDWEGVQEIDLVPGGSDVNVPFDHAIFLEWLGDRPEHWTPLIEAIQQSMESFAEKVEERSKN